MKFTPLKLMHRKFRLAEDGSPKVNTDKKTWTTPEIMLISKANLESGTKHTLHEGHFTPKHTNYHLPGGTTIPVVAPKFGNYVS